MQKVLFEYAFGVDLYFFVFYNKVYMSIYIHPNRRRKEDGICNTMRAGEPDVKEYDWFWAMRDRR